MRRLASGLVSSLQQQVRFSASLRPAERSLTRLQACRGAAARRLLSTDETLTLNIPVPFEAHKCEPPPQSVKTTKGATQRRLPRPAAAPPAPPPAAGRDALRRRSA